jgi:disulfide oxidoreductase YuzD
MLINFNLQFMNSKEKINKDNIWLKEPEEHDFPAALDYLELLFETADANNITKKLKQAKTIQKKSKDIFRASRLPLLPKDNIHVKENFKKIKNNKKLSPILLVRGQEQLIIADGYHRLCCAYYLTEDLEVPCRLV